MQTLPHQFLNRLAGLKRKTQFVLLRRPVREQSLNLLLLPRAQRALLAGLTPSRLGLDTPNPFSLIRLPPIRYRIAVHFQLRRYRNITHALLSPANSLLSHLPAAGRDVLVSLETGFQRPFSSK